MLTTMAQMFRSWGFKDEIESICLSYKQLEELKLSATQRKTLDEFMEAKLSARWMNSRFAAERIAEAEPMCPKCLDKSIKLNLR
jgi:hypothetical protein